MKKNFYLKSINYLVLLTALLAFTPKEAKSCVDPETLITVTVNYSTDLSEVAIVLGNLKFMDEEPNVFCSCAIGSLTEFYSHLEYVAFVETGTTTPYPNFEPWESSDPVDDAWGSAYPNLGNWEGFIASVINDGLGPDDDVELIIRASIPPGFFVTVSDVDTMLMLTALGTDAWDPVAEDLIADHQEVRNLHSDNSSLVYNEVGDDYFTMLDGGILSGSSDIDEVLAFSVSPNPTQGTFILSYNLEVGSEVAVNIRDVSGKLVYAQPAEWQAGGRQLMQINLAQALMPDGLYFVEVVSDQGRGYQRLLVSN